MMNWLKKQLGLEPMQPSSDSPERKRPKSKPTSSPVIHDRHELADYWGTIPQDPPKIKTRSFASRDFALSIVGESNYQDSLARAKLVGRDYNGMVYAYALLKPEPENEHDPNALRVMNKWHETIGYLSRRDALAYKEAAELWQSKGYLLQCQAKIGGPLGRIGGWLDLSPPKDIVAKFHDPKTRK